MRASLLFRPFALALAIAARLPAQTPAAPPAPTRIAVKAARLIDPKSATVVANAVVLVKATRSNKSAQDSPFPPAYQVIDLAAARCCPASSTATRTSPHNRPTTTRTSSGTARSTYAVIAHVYAKRTLEAGFTTVRDVGAAEFIDIALQRAIDSGSIPGPRMIPAGLSLSSTGGHGDLTGFSPYLKFDRR